MSPTHYEIAHQLEFAEVMPMLWNHVYFIIAQAVTTGALVLPSGFPPNAVDAPPSPMSQLALALTGSAFRGASTVLGENPLEKFHLGMSPLTRKVIPSLPETTNQRGLMPPLAVLRTSCQQQHRCLTSGRHQFMYTFPS